MMNMPNNTGDITTADDTSANICKDRGELGEVSPDGTTVQAAEAADEALDDRNVDDNMVVLRNDSESEPITAEQTEVTEPDTDDQQEPDAIEDAYETEEVYDAEEYELEPDDPPPKKKKRLPKWLRAWIKLIIKLCVLGLAGYLIWLYVGEAMIIHDNNMYPHIKDGDLVVVYKLQDTIKGDMVMYTYNGAKYIGRVIAGEGDIIDMSEEGAFTVNGLIPYENVFYDTHPYEDGTIDYPYTIPEGAYFLLNDMRESPADSRMYGCIPAEDIIGTVVFSVRHRGF